MIGGIDTITNSFWRRDPWAYDELAWRVFDDGMQSEWYERTGKLAEYMQAAWLAVCAGQHEAPDEIWCSEGFARSLGYVINAPRWKRAWWWLRYHPFWCRFECEPEDDGYED